MEGISNQRYRFPICGYDYDQSKLLTCLRKPDKLVKDTYLDLDGRLVKAGVWVRRREERKVPTSCSELAFSSREGVGTWEAKIRLSGDLVDSQFEEIEGQDAVLALLLQHLPGGTLQDLEPTAVLTTQRSTWEVREAGDPESGTINVVLNSVTGCLPDGSNSDTFRHDVGEVELTMDNAGGEGGDYEERKQQAVDGMRRALDLFMRRHSKLFPSEPAPVGKLSAYFRWKRGTTLHACDGGEGLSNSGHNGK